MTRFARRRPYLLAAIIVALVVVVILGGRSAWRLAWRLAGPPPPPRQTDLSQIADWMSVPYVSRAYRVPNTEVYKALGVEPENRRTQRIRDIAIETGITSAAAIERVQAAVREWQAAHPDPRPPAAEKPPDAPDAPDPRWPPLPPDIAPETPWPPSPSPAPSTGP